MVGAHQFGNLGETGATESKIWGQLRLFAALSKARVELASGGDGNGALLQKRRRILLLIRPSRMFYPNSGKVVARKLVAALTPHYPRSMVSSTGGRSGYLIEPKILRWEDRATEWSGKADRGKVSLPLYRFGSLVGSANSSWWTFGGDHPEDLLDAPFEAYAASLAGRANQNRSVFER